MISSTSIVAIVGAGSSGAVSLTTPGGTASLAGFTFIPAPTITAFSPGTAAAGALISITGTNFDNTSVLTLGGTPVTSFTVVSATSIVAIVGSGSSGAVSLTTPGGTASLAGFTFIPAPTITSFTPTIAAAGTLINITGTNFENTSAITLGGTPVSAFTVVSSTSIIAIVGSGSSGAVSLTTPGGTASLNGFTFIPAPTITLFSPAIAGAGAVMSITGTNFLGTSTITLGGTPVTSFTVISSTSIVAIVGTGSSGSVSLTTPGGSASMAGFIFSPPPSISSFTATTGPVGTLVTITGTNLNYPQSIMIAGVSAIPISNDGTTLVAMVMPGATTGGVSVTTPGGTANGSGNFIVIASQVPNTQQGNKLVGTGVAGFSRQGFSVSISADGNTAIVGGDGDNS
ncbi:MAG: beta strand repeat-containing protein, partial [Bacteroidota bacterium]